jgi:hypothetical protein
VEAGRDEVVRGDEAPEFPERGFDVLAMAELEAREARVEHVPHDPVGQAAGADTLSPRTVEHLVRGMFGGLSEEALAGLDLAAQGLSPQVRPAREGFEKVPFVSREGKWTIGRPREYIVYLTDDISQVVD